jgi:hypothetical protein
MKNLPEYLKELNQAYLSLEKMKRMTRDDENLSNEECQSQWTRLADMQDELSKLKGQAFNNHK